MVDQLKYESVRRWACWRKKKYDDPAVAHDAKRYLQHKHQTRLSVYRCPFREGGEAHHWHVGHVPSMEALQDLADAVRFMHQEDVR